MKKHKTMPLRVLAVMITIALVFATALVPATAQETTEEYYAAYAYQQQEAVQDVAEAESYEYTEVAQANEDATQNVFARVWHFFWRHFQIFSFSFHPFSGDTLLGYMFNSRWSFQWIFGYNMAYNMFAPAIGANIDTLGNHFYYDDMNWKVMLWKGTYSFGTTTGAEIGLYNRPLDRRLDHYNAARHRDWIGMSFSLYYDNRHLVTRPMETRWWQTAYVIHFGSQMFASPRDNVTLIGELRFNTPGKAQAFAGALAGHGFEEVTRPIVWEADCYDRFMIADDGVTVHFSWRTTLAYE